MKEGFNALKCGIIFQLISWGSFLLYDETGIMNEGYAMVFGVITLIGILIYYLFNAHKYLKKQKFNSLIFNITLFIFWVAASIGMSYL